MRRYHFLLLVCAETLPGEMGDRHLACCLSWDHVLLGKHLTSRGFGVSRDSILFWYSVSPECKPVNSPGVQLSQQQCCPVLGGGEGHIGLRDDVWYIRLQYHAFLKHFLGGFDDT